jgi:hypothetical protein
LLSLHVVVVSFEAIDCLLFLADYGSWAELFQSKSNQCFSRQDTTWTKLLYLNREPLVGASKRAYFGKTHKRIFPGPGSTQVCIKKMYHRDVTLDIASEIECLTVELNCLRWASALMGLIYNFMDKEDEIHGKPSFVVPKMRYVQVALAISFSGGKPSQAFLLEEEITDNFDKYINNTSAVPYDFVDSQRSHNAEFLSFTQHVQMLLTNEMAFVSDQQGTRFPLPDHFCRFINNLFFLKEG